MSDLITPYPGPIPNKTMSQAAFNAAVNEFLLWLKSFPGEMNSAIGNIMAMRDAKKYNPTKTYNQDGFTVPDAVYGDDGMTYVCVGTDVLGDNPVGSTTRNWVRLTLSIADARLYPLADGVLLTGNVLGLDFEKTGDHEITFQPGHCFDSTNETMLTLGAEQAVTIPTDAGGKWSCFLCDDGVIRLDTDEDGAALVAQGKKVRFVGPASNNAGGVVNPFTYSNSSNYMALDPAISFRTKYFARGQTETLTDLDFSSFLPVAEKYIEALVLELANIPNHYHRWWLKDYETGLAYHYELNNNGISPYGPQLVPFTRSKCYSRILASPGSSAATFTASWNIVGVKLKR